MKKISKILLSLLVIIMILSQTACSVNTRRTFTSLFGNNTSAREEVMLDSMATGMGGAIYKSANVYNGAVFAETAASTDIENGNTTNPRKLIKNVYISAESKNFDEAISNLVNDVEEYEGIIDSHSENNGAKYNNYAKSTHYAIRIPADKIDDFIEAIRKNINITSMSSDIVDVTDNYQFTLRRQETLLAELDKLKDLLKKASNVTDVITIEERISDINNELHNIENSLKNLDKRIDYSTINIDIREVKELTDTTKVPTKESMIEGFYSNLRATKNFLISVGVYIVTHAVSIIFTIIVILIVVFILRLIRKIIFGPEDMESLKKKEERKQLKAEKKLQELNNKIALKEAKDKLKEKKRNDKLEKEQAKEEERKQKEEKKRLDKIALKNSDKGKENTEVIVKDENFDYPESDPEPESYVTSIDEIEDSKEKTIEDVFNEEVKNTKEETKKDTKEKSNEKLDDSKKDSKVKTDDKGNKIIDLDFDFG